jgi:Tol biopolymer transport system component
MKTRYHLYAALFAFLLLVQASCKKDNPQPNNNNPKGTIVFGTAVDEVATTTLGTDASSDLFQGKDPYVCPDGRIIADLWGSYTANNSRQIIIANTNGTGMQTLVDLGQYNSGIYANPKMSRDGKFVSFNFYDTKSFIPVGIKVFQVGGGLMYTASKLWDGSWAPDGSLVASGTVYSLDVFGPFTYGTAGIYRISPDFQQTTPIGNGLTKPWYPCVSPDGKKISFAMNSHIWTMNMDGSGLTQITTGPNEETYSCWSPDGSKIATVSLGNIGATSGDALAIVSSNPANPVTVSQSESVWVKDKNNTLGLLNPIGNINWH